MKIEARLGMIFEASLKNFLKEDDRTEEKVQQLVVA